MKIHISFEFFFFKSNLKNTDKFWIKKIRSEKYRSIFGLKKIRSKKYRSIFSFYKRIFLVIADFET